MCDEGPYLPVAVETEASECATCRQQSVSSVCAVLHDSVLLSKVASWVAAPSFAQRYVLQE